MGEGGGQKYPKNDPYGLQIPPQYTQYIEHSLYKTLDSVLTMKKNTIQKENPKLQSNTPIQTETLLLPSLPYLDFLVGQAGQKQSFSLGRCMWLQFGIFILYDIEMIQSIREQNRRQYDWTYSVIMVCFCANRSTRENKQVTKKLLIN